jgi:hypothetical protein
VNKREARRVAKFRAGLILESVLSQGWDPQDLADKYGEDGLEMIRDELTDFAERLTNGGSA